MADSPAEVSEEAITVRSEQPFGVGHPSLMVKDVAWARSSQRKGDRDY
jgi:hypothetical protein